MDRRMLYWGAERDAGDRKGREVTNRAHRRRAYDRRSSIVADQAQETEYDADDQSNRVQSMARIWVGAWHWQEDGMRFREALSGMRVYRPEV